VWGVVVGTMLAGGGSIARRGRSQLYARMRKLVSGPKRGVVGSLLGKAWFCRLRWVPFAKVDDRWPAGRGGWGCGCVGVWFVWDGVWGGVGVGCWVGWVGWVCLWVLGVWGVGGWGGGVLVVWCGIREASVAQARNVSGGCCAQKSPGRWPEAKRPSRGSLFCLSGLCALLVECTPQARHR